MRRQLLLQRLLALFAAGWLLFDFPLLRLWLATPWGAFAVWGLFIVALALLVERGRP